MRLSQLLTRIVPTCLLIIGTNLHPPLKKEGPLSMTLCLSLFFLLLPQNCILPLNIYLDRSRLEMPVTMVMLYVFFISLVKYPPLPAPSDSLSLAISVCFHLLLAVNVLTYFLCTIMFTCYSFYFLFVMIRRPNQRLVVNTGLRASEMRKLERVLIPLYTIDQSGAGGLREQPGTTVSYLSDRIPARERNTPDAGVPPLLPWRLHQAVAL